MAKKDIILDNIFLLENLQGGVVYSDFDPPFRLRFCTEGMAELSGYTVDELLNMYQMDLVYEQDIESLGIEVGRQLDVGDTFSVEYRLKKKDGGLVYVLDKAKAVMHDDNKKYIHCLLTDISDFKKMEQALWLSQEKYKLALKQSGNIILEYDLSTKRLVFSENYECVFNGIAPIGDISEITNTDWLESEFINEFLQLFHDVIENKTTGTMELRLSQYDKNYIWGSLHLTPVFNIKGEAYAIVGCLKNIDKEKQHINYLTERSEKDGLTGIYNRVYMEEKINHFINPLELKGALIIIDIDNFKSINDNNGHAFGDEVLKTLVDVVKKAIPEDAIFGRLGGDEFLIFLPKVDSKEELSIISQNIINFMIEANHKQIFLMPTTLSIGATIRNEKINNFSGLYKRADKALYQTKANGRNGFTIG